MKAPRQTSRKYRIDNLLPALRHFAGARREALTRGFTDNGGAIHSAERIADILGQMVCYPDVSALALKRYPQAERSVAANEALQRDEAVEIEHVLPKRAFAQHLCTLIEEGKPDNEVVDYVRTNYRLVLLTKEERSRLDRLNRSGIVEDRLAKAGIAMWRP